jgi:hypothetical protein
MPKTLKEKFDPDNCCKSTDVLMYLQDSNGFGTIRELPPKVPEGWVQVEWDNGYINNYRVGADQAYDVMFVPGTYNPSAG